MSDNSERAGKYQILDVAGRDGMGMVYVGHDPFSDRKVAINVCPMGDPEYSSAHLPRKLFFNEAQSAGVLETLNIQRVFDAEEVDGDPYIVMEFVEGTERSGPRLLDRIISVFCSILRLGFRACCAPDLCEKALHLPDFGQHARKNRRPSRRRSSRTS